MEILKNHSSGLSIPQNLIDANCCSAFYLKLNILLSVAAVDTVCA